MSKTKAMTMLLAAGTMLGAASLVEAQSACAPRDQVIERLAAKYGESRQSIGLGANNAVIEVFASLETGTWTITATTVDGMTCLMASGQAFEELADTLPPKGEDA
jgi:hypothetical protein